MSDGERAGSSIRALQHEHRLAEFERRTDLPMLLLSLAYTAILVAPALSQSIAEHSRTLEAISWLLWGVFATEFVGRVALAPRRPKYIVTHWYDLAIVVLPFLRPLRVLRVLRFLRLLGLATRTTLTARRILSTHGLGYVLLLGVIVVVVAAFTIHEAEQAIEDASIQDIPTALWWAVATVTTVGYGDAVPKTPLGRGVAVVLMLIGISLLGVITASIAAFFVREDDSAEHAEVMESLQRLEVRLARIESEMAPEQEPPQTN